MELKRNLPTAFKTALGGFFHPVIMVHLDWPGGAIYAHSSKGDISYDSQTWMGVGDFGRIDVPEEQAGLVASSAVITWLGDATSLFDREDDVIRNRLGQILMGMTTERGGNTLVSDPVELFSGGMDAMMFRGEDENGNRKLSMQLTVSSGVAARGSATVNHSAEERKALNPTDTSGEHLVNNLAIVKTLYWPAK